MFGHTAFMNPDAKMHKYSYVELGDTKVMKKLKIDDSAHMNLEYQHLVTLLIFLEHTLKRQSFFNMQTLMLH